MQIVNFIPTASDHQDANSRSVKLGGIRNRRQVVVRPIRSTLCMRDCAHLLRIALCVRSLQRD
jgi:hypothetical protein